jgi:hypothetical protein
MSSAVVVALAVAVAVCFAPAWLLARARGDRVQDRLVGPHDMRPEVVRNASIGHALRMAAFVSWLAFGARGDPWPVVVGAISFAAGVRFVHYWREPLLAFVDEASRTDRSITPHAFIEAHHGGDARVRRLAAGLTLCGLSGLLLVEALAVVAFLAPLSGGLSAAAAVAVVLVTVAALPTLLNGHWLAMHSSQLLLGIAYFGLFGATAAFLYMHVSGLAPLPPHGVVAVAGVASLGAILLVRRRSRYVDNPAHSAAPNLVHGRRSMAVRLLGRFAKVLNVCISVFLVLIVVLVSMALYGAGVHDAARKLVTVIRTPTSLPIAAFVALCVFPLCHPLVDVANWQALAALHRRSVEPARGATLLRGVFGVYALEAAFAWLWMWMLGAIALFAVPVPATSDAVRAIVTGMVSADHAVTVAAQALLIVAAFAIVLSSMSAMLSALAWTIPCGLPSFATVPARASVKVSGRRRTRAAAGALVLAAAVAVAMASGLGDLRFGDRFIAWALAAGSLQLALAPLVAVTLVDRRRGIACRVGGGWALAILVGGASAALTVVGIHLATGSEAWLWAAAPACLAAAGIVLLCARFASARAV